MTYTLITGGSRGIGKALARECASRGMNLLLIAKIKSTLDTTAKELRSEFPVKVDSKVVDLRDQDGPQRVWDWCKNEGYRVNVLINNAGVAGSTSFEATPPEYSDERILVNNRALVLLTRIFLPELRSHPRAYILNIGSLSAYYPIGYKSVYAASKAFVLSFSRALKQELRDSPVSITVINPNGVRTNPGTFERIDTHPTWRKRFFIIEPESIAVLAIDQMLKGKLVVVPGILNRFLIFLSRILPQGYRDRSAARIFKSELKV